MIKYTCIDNMSNKLSIERRLPETSMDRLTVRFVYQSHNIGVEMRKSLLQAFVLLTVLSLVLSACGAQVEEVGGFQIPAVEKGKFNVAMVLIGPHDDGGWSQAHYEGLLY